MPETSTCDRCEAVITYDLFDRPSCYNFPVQTDGGDSQQYEMVSRELCQACIEDMLAWVDGDYSREGAVQLPDGIKSGEVLRRYADELDDLADSIEAELQVE